MPATANVQLEADSNVYHFQGRAYHDHNSSLLPLHDLNIDKWWWGRIALPDQEFIWYSLLSDNQSPPINMFITISQQGDVQVLEEGSCTLNNMQKSIFGLSSPSHFILDTPWQEKISVEVRNTVDDGPFYQRYIVHAKTQKGAGFGIAEQVVPALVDGDWMRPLVKMRVANPRKNASKNSFWLPLFTGPKNGRWTRLIQQLFARNLNRKKKKK